MERRGRPITQVVHVTMLYVVVAAVGIETVDRQTLWIRHRGLLEEHTVDDAEDRGVGSDAQRECQQRPGGTARLKEGRLNQNGPAFHGDGLA